jgi:hypothetical protein
MASSKCSEKITAKEEEMFDHLKKREERQMEGIPEGVPSLAPLALAEHAGWGPQSPPPSEVESEAPMGRPSLVGDRRSAGGVGGDSAAGRQGMQVRLA